MAVAARGGSLLRRLERLTRTSPAPDTGRGRALSAVAAGAGLAAVLSVSVGMMVFPRTVAAMHASPTAPSRYVVHARDDAGPFTVAVAGGRVVRAVIGGVAVPSAAIRQQGDSVVLPSGTGAFTIRLRPGGGFSWSSRTP